MIGSQDFTLMSGNSCEILVTVTNAAGDAYDFTGHTLEWRMRKESSVRDLVLTKTTGSGIIAVTGLVTITIVPADTTSLNYGNYYHELVTTKTITGEIETLCYGTINLLKSGVA